jgi:hypothetical protein
MIYPQATKYVETQKDPFSYLFNGFRTALNSNEDNVLITCDIVSEMTILTLKLKQRSSRNNRTTIIAFAQENPDGSIVINKTLDAWLNNKQFGNRVYVAGQGSLL